MSERKRRPRRKAATAGAKKLKRALRLLEETDSETDESSDEKGAAADDFSKVLTEMVFPMVVKDTHGSHFVMTHTNEVGEARVKHIVVGGVGNSVWRMAEESMVAPFASFTILFRHDCVAITKWRLRFTEESNARGVLSTRCDTEWTERVGAARNGLSIIGDALFRSISTRAFLQKKLRASIDFPKLLWDALAYVVLDKLSDTYDEDNEEETDSRGNWQIALDYERALLVFGRHKVCNDAFAGNRQLHTFEVVLKSMRNSTGRDRLQCKWWVREVEVPENGPMVQISNWHEREHYLSSH